MGNSTKRSWVVPVLVGNSLDTLKFSGSGIVVSKQHILTCRHVLQDGNGNPYPHVGVNAPSGSVVYSDGVPREIDDDVALLTLSGAITTTPPFFVDKMAAEALEQLKGRSDVQWTYYGWTDVKKFHVGGLEKLIHYSCRNDKAYALQLLGGVPNGCSGGALVIPLDGTDYCAGMLCLGGMKFHETGGRGAPSSVICASETIVDAILKYQLLQEIKPRLETISLNDIVGRRKKAHTCRWSIMARFIVVLVAVLLAFLCWLILHRPDPKDWLDENIGEGQWFCFANNHLDSIGIIRLPRDFLVEYPFKTIDFQRSEPYTKGERVPGDGGATGNFDDGILMTLEECPNYVAIKKWQDQAKKPMAIDSPLLDERLGQGNWCCTSVGQKDAIFVHTLIEQTEIRYPIVAVDFDNKKYGVGNTIPPFKEKGATFWLDGELTPESCPCVK